MRKLSGIIAEDEESVFKYDAGRLGSLYLISGLLSERATFFNRLISVLGSAKGREVGKHYLLKWKTLPNKFLCVYYCSASIHDDLFPRIDAQPISFSDFLVSGDSLAYYKKRYRWQERDTMNYKIVFSFQDIRSVFIDFLLEEPQFRRMIVTSLVDYKNICGGYSFFRGHARFSYSLIPSLFRGKWNEKELYEDAKDFLSLDSSKYEDLAEMQHYGLPTRLLDVSLDPEVALYMACNTVFNSPETINDIGVVYGFRHSNVISRAEAQTFCSGSKSLEDFRIVEYESPKGNERMARQMGTFIIFGDDRAIEAEPLCYVINKQKILKQLDSIGKNERTLIPDEEHICNYIKEKNKPTV